MGQRSIPGFCERCGQRFELAQPARGERDLGLDRIKASFRYCVGCGLYVGRTCCWNPDAVACIADAPPFALTTTHPPGATPDSSSNEAEVRRGLEELAASLEALEQFEEPARPVPKSDTDREIGRQAWDAAWWAVGWLIARVETSRDAAAKALWRTPTQPDGRLAALEERYGRARSLVEGRLRAAGETMLQAPLRQASSAVTVGALTAVVLLTFSTAAMLQLGYLNPFAVNRSAAASQPEGAVLGGAASPTPSIAAASTPTTVARQAVIALLDFDELRIGQLAGPSDEIGSVTGAAEVVAFPSPFDRSIRVHGDGPHRFCMPTAELDDGALSFDMDLYTKAASASGRLRLSIAPTGSSATIVSVPLELLGSLRLEAWHRLHAAWTPGQPVAIAIGEAAQGQLHRLTVAPVRDGHADPGAVCVAVSGMANDAELLIDNLRVQQ